MQWDVDNLERFYKSPLGKQVQKSITRRFQFLLKDPLHFSNTSTNACLGYVYPFLKAFENTPLTCTVLPPKQGISFYTKPSLVVAEECSLPFEDKSIDFLLMIHWLENTPDPLPRLRESWRVLKDGGEILLLVPNKRSLWPTCEHTPFGMKYPFSYTQLINCLRDTFFTPTYLESILHFFPCTSEWLLPSIPLFEKTGSHLGITLNRFWAGGWVVKATKCLYAPVSKTSSTNPRSLKSALPFSHSRVKE